MRTAILIGSSLIAHTIDSNALAQLPIFVGAGVIFIMAVSVCADIIEFLYVKHF